MKRIVFAVVVAAASNAIACGKRASDTATGSGSGSGPTSGSSTGSDSPAAGSGAGSASATAGTGSASTRDPIADENPTLSVVKAAFQGTVPSLPQLSKDGRTAAIELDTQVDLSSASTYAVAFVGTGTNATPNVITLVDGRLAHVLLEGGSEPGKPAKIDTAALATTAATITKRLQDEGFSAFERKIEELAPGEPIAVGPAKLQLAESDNGTLSIAVLDGKGKPATKDSVKPVVMGKVADLECVSQPIPRHAWVDTPRKRLLVEVGWNAGPDQCNAPDASYRLYMLP